MAFKDEVKSFIEDNFMVEFSSDFSNEDSFLEYGIIDSTGVLELVLHLEETFNIKVEDNEILPENLDSLDGIDKFLQQKGVGNGTG